MSDYAIANLKEIDDSAGEYAPDLEALSPASTSTRSISG